ncbi:MAG: NAD(P)H-dependent glycerol-3-phosphate dehydrogenase [Polyangiales bacterium]
MSAVPFAPPPTQTPRKVAVLGAGSWGTALAKLVADKGISTALWARRPHAAAAMAQSRENPDYLPGARLPDCLRPTACLDEALDGAEWVLLVVPTQSMRAFAKQLVPVLAPTACLISASKGIEQGSLALVSEILTDTLPDAQHPRLAYLAGPSFAREVADAVPTAVCVASQTPAVALAAQQLLSTHSFRVYTSNDVVGVELGGALKNVIAIAVGCADGLGLGHNARAALITRGLAEITRLGVAVGAAPLTFAGLCGMGDLVLTCTGPLSRNRQVGFALGQGQPLSEVLQRMHMVAEGVATAASAMHLAQRHGVDVPIIEQAYRVLHQGHAPADAIEALLSRPLKAEHDFG